MNTSSNGRGWALDLALLAAATLVFFHRAALLQGAFFVQDVMIQNYPFRHFFAQALGRGELPLWAAAINCGFPLFAEGQAGPLYPLNILMALLLPTYAALNYAVIFHLWLAGAGTYSFLRLLGCLRPAALLGGLTLALSGFLVIRAMSPNYLAVCAWVPFLFLLVELSLRRQRPFYLLLAAAVVGLQSLAGHPQAMVYGLGAALLYGFYGGWVYRAAWPYWALLAGVPVLGGGLAAVQLLPTAELVQVSARGGGLPWEQFVQMSLPPERLLTLWLPNFFGNSGTASYWGREAGFFIQLCGYMGIIPLLLALVAGFERRHRPTLFFWALAGAGLILSLGRFTSIFHLLYQIPGLDFFRIPTRFLQWFAFAVAVLAGLGLDQVLRTAGGRRHWGWAWMGGLLLVGLAAAVGINYKVLVEAVVSGEEWLRFYRADLLADSLRTGALLILGSWLLVSRNARRAAWLLPLLVAADLYSFGGRFNAVIDPEVYQTPPASARAILEDAEDRAKGTPVAPRILSLVSEKNSSYDWHSGWVHDRTSYAGYAGTLRMYTGSQFGLANALPGWSPLHLQRHWEFVRGYLGFVDIADVQYLLHSGPLERGGFDLIHQEVVWVYRNRVVPPRAYFADQYRVLAPEEGLSYMRSRSFAAGQHAYLEEEPSEPVVRSGGQPQIVAYQDERVDIEIAGGGSGLLVLSDTYYPGWQVFADGRELPLLRANHVFRGVVLPEGTKQVVFGYQPASFSWGLGITVATLVIWSALLWGLRRRRLDMRGAGAEPDLPPLRSLATQIVLIALVHGLVSRWPLWADALERCRALGVGG
ncbi:MAG: YfhO family protein [Candidatus Latescibacteria bacterium]|nr:YfhO family protein [Candidatus Latescibacterota bacterium]